MHPNNAPQQCNAAATAVLLQTQRQPAHHIKLLSDKLFVNTT
jgi:hypothetical protein